jgi:DNA-binding LacI/PurR family transcriptional regulator
VGIKELARHLNISIGTVSRALNGHPEVNAETRKRVLEAAAALGYAPDQAGRSLRQGTLNVVALLLSTNLTSKTDAMFFMELSRGIQDKLAEHDLDLVLHLNKPGVDMLDRVRRVVERKQADALILAETRDNDPRLDYLAGRDFPFATMGRSWSGGTHPWMDLDFDFAMRAAIDRLAGFGHRRVALVTGDPGYMLDNMLQDAFRRELAGHGLGVDEALMIRADTHEAGGYQAMTRFLALEAPPTAVIFPHYRAVVGAYSCLAEAGLQPGRDIAIVNCSTDTAIAEFMAPPLTCFRLDLYGLGQRLAEALLASMPRFADRFDGVLVQEIWPWELVARDSDAFRVG